MWKFQMLVIIFQLNNNEQTKSEITEIVFA